MEYRHELVMPNEHLPFRMFLFEGRYGNYQVSKHWHHSLELFYVQQGRITFMINDTETVIEEHDFIIVNSNVVHEIHSPQENRTIVLQIPLTEFNEDQQQQMFLNFMKQDAAKNDILMKMMDRMFTYYEKKEAGYLFKVKSSYYEFLYYLSTEFKDASVNEDEIKIKKQLDRLGNITEYMKQHYKEELTLQQIADVFGFTPAYLSRMFQKYAQIPYHTYLSDLRVSYAVRELMNSTHTISEIAFAHGFSDSRSFNRAFMKRYGSLPSVYRNKIKTVM